jgi:FtsH-binding integral membrane protein
VIKNLILNWGSKLLDALVAILLVMVIVGSIITMFSVSFGAGLGMLLGGISWIVIIFFVIYILIDIRDSLKQIAEKNNGEV